MTNLPVQVEQLINSMLREQDNMNIRMNYMNTLLDIRDAIDSSVKKFEKQKGFKLNNKRA
jgi:aspartyl/asparaginyl-tRNA synthetase